MTKYIVRPRPPEVFSDPTALTAFVSAFQNLIYNVPWLRSCLGNKERGGYRLLIILPSHSVNSCL